GVPGAFCAPVGGVRRPVRKLCADPGREVSLPAGEGLIPLTLANNPEVDLVGFGVPLVGGARLFELGAGDAVPAVFLQFPHAAARGNFVLKFASGLANPGAPTPFVPWR